MDSYKKIIAGIAGIFIGAAQIISVNAATDDVSVQTDVPVVQVSNLQYSYDQMKQDLETLQEKYPEQMQIESLGTTADGREILEAVLGDVNAEHPSYSGSGDDACKRIYEYGSCDEPDRGLSEVFRRTELQ